MSIAITAAIVAAFLAVEASRAARNERAQRRRGGVEPTGDVYRAMRVVYPAAFLAMLVEGMWRGGAPAAVFASGAVLLALSKALKWWAIFALGEAWTFRVVVVPGASLVVSGPYRYLRHPNYVAVVGELVAVAAMAGALVAGPLATIVFGALIARRIAVENRALNAILPRS